jgi:hypothetical protein
VGCNRALRGIRRRQQDSDHDRLGDGDLLEEESGQEFIPIG